MQIYDAMTILIIFNIVKVSDRLLFKSFRMRNWNAWEYV